MKLSEMTTSQACEVMCDIVEPISNILEDPKSVSALKEIVDKYKKDDVSVSVSEMVGFAMKKFVPLILKSHKTDTLKIFGILVGKTEKQMEEQLFVETIKDIKESIDGDLLQLFKQSAITERAESLAE